MKKANFIMAIIRLTMETLLIAIPALCGAMYILDDIMYYEEWAVAFFVPFAILVIWKLVKLQIIEIKEAKDKTK